MKKIALITGASRGLGAAMAQALCRTHHIMAVARTTGALEELDDTIKKADGSATLAPMDITVPQAMQVLCRGIFDRWGQLDLWVHPAIHASPLTPASDITDKDFTKVFDTNVVATARLIGYVAPLLGSEGQAVFFDDPVAGLPFYGAYGASKAAQIALARSWQAEGMSMGPKVHIMCPAPMPTATRARFHPSEDPDTLTPCAVAAADIVAQLGAP